MGWRVALSPFFTISMLATLSYFTTTSLCLQTQDFLLGIYCVLFTAVLRYETIYMLYRFHYRQLDRQTNLGTKLVLMIKALQA